MALLSRSNMDKTPKEEAVHAENEMDSLLNRLNVQACSWVWNAL